MVREGVFGVGGGGEVKDNLGFVSVSLKQ